MASIVPFPPSKTTFHVKCHPFHPKCHLYLSQHPLPLGTGRAELRLCPPPLPPNLSTTCNFHGQQRPAQVSALVYFYFPESPHLQARGEHVLLRWDSWLGPVFPSESLSLGAPPSGHRFSSPCQNPPTACHMQNAHSDSGHFPSRCLAVVDTQRDRGAHRSALVSLTGSPRCHLTSGPPFKFKGWLSARPSEAHSAWHVAATQRITPDPSSEHQPQPLEHTAEGPRLPSSSY